MKHHLRILIFLEIHAYIETSCTGHFFVPCRRWTKTLTICHARWRKCQTVWPGHSRRQIPRCRNTGVNQLVVRNWRMFCFFFFFFFFFFGPSNHLRLSQILYLRLADKKFAPKKPPSSCEDLIHLQQVGDGFGSLTVPKPKSHCFH